MRSDIVDRIYLRSSRDVKSARAMYQEAFGKSVTDPGIDDTLIELATSAITEKEVTVAVPTHVLLALVLRPRKAGMGRPQKEVWARRAEGLAVRMASRRWAELRPSLGSKRAKHQAAEEAHAKHGEVARASVETIKAKMRLPKSD